MRAAAVLRGTPRRERRSALLVAAIIAALWGAALALSAAGGGGGAPLHDMPGAHGHAGSHAGAAAPGLLALAVMWSAMMVVMMVPAEAPALAERLRPRRGRASPARAAAFFAGLLATWLAFSALAALAHLALERRLLLGADGTLASPLAAAALVGAIGLFQLTPQKRRCLERCHAAGEGEPLVTRPGAGAALAAGLHHGTVSLASCGLLMLLPLGLGGMRLAPMAAITALLVAEKLGRPGLVIARAAGAALLAWSLVTVAGAG